MTFFYTHQRIEGIRYSYEINEKSAEIDKLLDQRRELEYNVARLKSPAYLEMQLAKSDVRMVLPERWEVFETVGSEEEYAPPALPLLVRNIVGFFALKSEAQATPSSDNLTKKPF
jgi:hypothetical protein